MNMFEWITKGNKKSPPGPIKGIDIKEVATRLSDELYPQENEERGNKMKKWRLKDFEDLTAEEHRWLFINQYELYSFEKQNFYSSEHINPKYVESFQINMQTKLKISDCIKLLNKGLFVEVESE